jgi:hypothetical protein
MHSSQFDLQTDSRFIASSAGAAGSSMTSLRRTGPCTDHFVALARRMGLKAQGTAAMLLVKEGGISRISESILSFQCL